LTQKNKNL